MTLREAQILTLRVLKQVMEEKLDQHNVQLAQVGDFLSLSVCTFTVCLQVTKEKGFEILDEAKLKGVIDEM
jgi:20S proteasome subunit alpha 5